MGQMNYKCAFCRAKAFKHWCVQAIEATQEHIVLPLLVSQIDYYRLGCLPQLRVERFHSVGRVDHLAGRLRETEVRDHVLPVAALGLHGHRVLLAPDFFKYSPASLSVSRYKSRSYLFGHSEYFAKS